MRGGASEVARSWYESLPLGDGITLIRERHVAPWLRCNIWHVRGRDRDLVIDTGMGLRPLRREVPELAERALSAIATHTHFDHMGGLYQFEHRLGHATEADIAADPRPERTCADSGWVRVETFSALPFKGFSYRDFTVRPAPLTGYLDEGDVLDLGDRQLKVFHLPGHSPGSIALYEAATETLFSGDVIYDGLLIDDIYHSDAEAYRESLARLGELPVRTVHAGHFRSFSGEEMRAIIGEYMAGGRRMVDADAWLAEQIAACGGGARCDT